MWVVLSRVGTGARERGIEVDRKGPCQGDCVLKTSNLNPVHLLYSVSTKKIKFGLGSDNLQSSIVFQERQACHAFCRLEKVSHSINLSLSLSSLHPPLSVSLSPSRSLYSSTLCIRFDRDVIIPSKRFSPWIKEPPKISKLQQGTVKLLMGVTAITPSYTP